LSYGIGECLEKRPKRLTLVAAMARSSRVIGVSNKMPWHLPVDLAHFKRVTLDKPILMGRKTFESIGRVLPGRENIVLTRDVHWHVKGVRVFHSVPDVLEKYSKNEELMVIGGGDLYHQLLPVANRMWLTYVDWTGQGDAFFPEFDQQQWRVVSAETHAADDTNKHHCEFVQLERL
jgi:dihydrofolate reductase